MEVRKGIALLAAGVAIVFCCGATWSPAPGQETLPVDVVVTASPAATASPTATPAATPTATSTRAGTSAPTTGVDGVSSSPLIQAVSPPSQPKRFVVLGDSLSAWTYGRRSRTHTAGAWPELLDSLHSGLVLAHNSAIPGNTTTEMAARLRRDVFAYRPDLLIVMGGTNDVGADWPGSVTVANLTAIVRAAKARGVEVVLLTIPPNNTLFSADYRQLWQINRSLKAMAAAEGIRVIDVATALAASNGHLQKAYAGADRLHLNAQGEAVLAQTVYRALYPAGPEVWEAQAKTTEQKSSSGAFGPKRPD